MRLIAIIYTIRICFLVLISNGLAYKSSLRSHYRRAVRTAHWIDFGKAHAFVHAVRL